MLLLEPAYKSIFTSFSLTVTPSGASSSQEAATRLFFLVAVLAPFKVASVKKTYEIHSGAAFLINFCVKSHKLDLREDADRPASWRSIRPLEEPGFDASCPGCQWRATAWPWHQGHEAPSCWNTIRRFVLIRQKGRCRKQRLRRGVVLHRVVWGAHGIQSFSQFSTSCLNTESYCCWEKKYLVDR